MHARLTRTATLAVAALVAFGAAGCTGSEPAPQAKRTLVIGVEAPLTGDRSADGLAAASAVELAVKQANAKGNLPVRLRVERADDGGVADQASQAAQRLVDDARVVAVVGPLADLAVEKAAPIYSGAHLSAISLAADSAGAADGVNQMLAPAATLGLRAADYLVRGIKARSLYLVDDGTPSGKATADALQGPAKAAGLDVNADTVPPTDDKGYAAAAKKAVGTNPDVVFYSGGVDEGAAFAKALRGAGFKGIPMAGPQLTEAAFIAHAEQAAEGWVTVCGCAAATLDPAAADFVRAFRAAYHQDPGLYAAAAYDAANTVIAALSKVTGDLTRESAGRALNRVTYQGITGTVKFGRDGQRSSAPVFVYEVKGGRRVLKGSVSVLTAG